jgi:2-polyprenyl-6-methoxyphenol hydroxylase-like FAD-dependent oxidoreductase
MQLPAFFYTRSGTILVFAMDDKTIQWATTSPVPDRDRHTWQAYKTSGQAVAQLRTDWGHVTLEPIQSLIRNVNDENIRLWAPYEVPDLPRWHTARTCVLGDAAHAIPPSMGQGAAQAFEDVGVMARLLIDSTTTTSFDRIFAQFESLRRPRIDLVRKMTAKAESTRGATSSGLAWYVKRTVMWGTFMVFGKGKESYMTGGQVTGYDATDVDVQV